MATVFPMNSTTVQTHKFGTFIDAFGCEIDTSSVGGGDGVSSEEEWFLLRRDCTNRWNRCDSTRHLFNSSNKCSGCHPSRCLPLGASLP